jgi:hypothetical protein
MPMPKHLEGKAVPISEQPNRGKGAGRKPKLVRKWIKECNVSKEDAQNMLNSLLHSYSFKELNQLQKTEYDSVSAATYAMIAAIVRVSRKGNLSPLLEMYKFLFEKDEKKISVTHHSAEYVELKDAILKNILKEETQEAIIKELETAAGHETDEE